MYRNTESLGCIPGTDISGISSVIQRQQTSLEKEIRFVVIRDGGGGGEVGIGWRCSKCTNLQLHASMLSCFSCFRLFVILWTVTGQAPLFMKLSRQECWSVLPCPSPGDLPYPGTEPTSPALVGRFFITQPPGKPHWKILLRKRNGKP